MGWTGRGGWPWALAVKEGEIGEGQAAGERESSRRLELIECCAFPLRPPAHGCSAAAAAAATAAAALL